MAKKFVKTSEATRILGIHWHTLHKWSNEGKIETIKPENGYRLYNIEDFVKKEKEDEKKKKDLLLSCFYKKPKRRLEAANSFYEKKLSGT